MLVQYYIISIFSSGSELHIDERCPQVNFLDSEQELSANEIDGRRELAMMRTVPRDSDIRSRCRTNRSFLINSLQDTAQRNHPDCRPNLSYRRKPPRRLR